MYKVIAVLAMLFTSILASYASPILLSPEVDARYCGFVPRTASGDIKRSTAELTKFKSYNPCPSTGLTTGSCPGWAIDHIYSLSLGGCDKVINMQWLPLAGKSCSSDYCKDRWERNIHPNIDPEMPGYNPACCKPKLVSPEYTQEETQP